MTTKNVFERNPRKTLAMLLLGIFFAFDFGLGCFFNPEIPGTPDANYHHDLQKDFQGTKDWANRTYPFFTNSLGFVDRSDRQVPLRTKGWRILFLGDSFTEGLGYAYDQTFVGRFAAAVAPSGTEVLNAAVASYSPKLYFLKTKYLLNNVGLKFDELIVFIDISDIQNEIDYEKFVPSGNLALSEFYLVNSIDAFLRGASLTYHWLRETVLDRQLHFLPERSSLRTNFHSFDEWEDQRSYWTINDEVFNDWGSEGLRLAGEHMNKLYGLCGKHHIQLTIAVYPWPLQIYTRDLESRQVKFWKAFSEKRGIGFLNLFPDFINEEPFDKIYDQYFIQDDLHWNETGHKLVSDRLLKFWLKQHASQQISSD